MAQLATASFWELPALSFVQSPSPEQCLNKKAANQRNELPQLQDGAHENLQDIDAVMSDSEITDGSDPMQDNPATVSSTGEHHNPQTPVMETGDADEFLLNYSSDDEEMSDGSSTGDDDEEMSDSLIMGDGAVDAIDAEAERAKKKAECDNVESFSRKHFSTLEKQMESCLAEIIELGKVSRKKNKSIKMSNLLTAVKRCQIIQRACAVKYANATEGRRKFKKSASSFAEAKHPKTTEEIMACISGPEELKNPWSGSAESASDLPEGGLLMRVTDEASRAKLYPDQGFLSGGFGADLKTARGRREAMELHLNWGNRKPTAFISTTGCAVDFIKWRVPHMVKRDGKKPSRCTVKLTYINAYARQATGLPTLRVVEEIARYNVMTSGGRDEPWFEDEYILPFRVDPEHIVATHCWIAVLKYMKTHGCDYAAFHRAVVLPAFAEHEAARRESRPVNAKNSCVCWHCCDS